MDFGYSPQQVESLRHEVRNYNQLKDAVMLAAEDWIDLRSYQEDMRFILDTYVSAHDSTVVSKLDDTPLVELLADKASTTPVDAIIDGVAPGNNGKAEIIDANLTREIIRKMPVNRAYYGKMSELLRKVIEERRLEAISYAEYLRQVAELARRILSPEQTENYPASVRTRAATRALYDFVQNREEFEGLDLEQVALDLDESIRDSAESGWLANLQKQRRIKKAIDAVLDELELVETHIDALVDEFFDLISQQDEYTNV